MTTIERLRELVAQEVSDEKTKAIKLMIIGTQLADYGSRLIVDGSEQMLKQRVNRVMAAVRDIERALITNAKNTEGSIKAFKDAFMGDRMVLLAEIIVELHGLTEDSLQEVLKAIAK